MTLAITATVLVGFAFTYFAPVMSGTYPKVSPTGAAYRIGLAVCLAVEGGILLLTPSPAGRLLARGLAWIGDAFTFLY